MKATRDFFRIRLNQMIDLRHPLAVPAKRMSWQAVKASMVHRYIVRAVAANDILRLVAI